MARDRYRGVCSPRALLHPNGQANWLIDFYSGFVCTSCIRLQWSVVNGKRSIIREDIPPQKHYTAMVRLTDLLTYLAAFAHRRVSYKRLQWLFVREGCYLPLGPIKSQWPGQLTYWLLQSVCWTCKEMFLKKTCYDLCTWVLHCHNDNFGIA